MSGLCIVEHGSAKSLTVKRTPSVKASAHVVGNVSEVVPKLDECPWYRGVCALGVS